MPAYIVKAVAIHPSIGDTIVWYCVMRTSDGVEMCRSVNEDHAETIAAALIAATP